MPSSVRSSVRRNGAAQVLGLEDELSFGSDEDLMETIGEIEVPEVPPLPELPVDTRSQSNRLRMSSKSSASLKSNSSKSSKRNDSLASTTHLLPPLPPVPMGASTLDLPTDMFGERDRPKRGSLMGAFKVKKGLRRWRDDQSSRASFMTETSQASTMSLHKVTSNASSRPSITSSLAYTPSTHASSTVPHIAPLSLPSLDSVDRISLSRQSVAESYDAKKAYEAITPSYTPTKLSLSRKTGATWAPSEISSAILPAFPATLSSLEPITVFTAQASKRPPSSILSGAEKTNGFRQPSASTRWTPCTMVFTLFKVSLSGDDAAIANADGVDRERTVAHIHVFSSQRASGSPGMRRSKSSAGLQFDPSAPRVEVERRTLSRDSTASICENYTDADGRPVVLSIYFGNEDRTKGNNEWIIEMKNQAQLDEWIRQIKKTAIMINAEELGYGEAIRPVYDNTSQTADDLAHTLSVHARSVAEGRTRDAPEEIVPKSSPQSSSSQQDERRTSLEALQGIALSRSRSADAAEARSGSLRRAHRKSVIVGPASTIQEGRTRDYLGEHDPDSLSSLSGLTLNGLSFGSSLSFPAPPSDLPFPAPPVDMPPPRSARVHVVQAIQPLTQVEKTTSPALSSSSRLAANAGSPAMASTPNMGVVPGSSNASLASSLRVGGRPSPPMASTPSFGSQLSTPGVNSSASASEDEAVVVSPPTPPRRSGSESNTPRPAAVSVLQGQARGHAPSIASTTHSGTSSTSRLRRLRGKPAVIDVMAEFTSVECENLPPQMDEDDEPIVIREDRERRIRFA